MKVGSLFSGIGGLDLGLERAGMSVIWQSEIDPYAKRVLRKHWPNVPNLGDITTIDWTTVERPDLICGGYPCQPFSLAGVRRGENDPRHLWPHFLGAIRHLRPRLALLENVPGHRSLGMGRVLGDLVAIGYDTEWDSIPASAVGAPHQRDRLFIVAYTAGSCEPSKPWFPHGQALVGPRVGAGRRAVLGHLAAGTGGLGRVEPKCEGDAPDTVRDVIREEPISIGRCGCPTVARVDGAHRRLAHTDRQRLADVQGGAACPECSGSGAADSAGWWNVEPDVGRVADGVPHRVDRLRTLGNAVVPQVAEWIGRRIMEAAA